ncbi:unnamed protein product [Somion occarium]|uniref:HhH-GPD domain-containing protein n=1 Tax=Somion occarium TaxID=3059160 RepID=A0ABP1DP51_9APHY
MVKKRRLSSSSDEFVASDGSANDTYQPVPNSSRKRQGPKKLKPSSSRRRATRTAGKDDASDTPGNIDPGVAYQALPHGVSTHAISDAKPLRKSLLEWYANVHETRGMPWRKPYDPALGPEERSQRAYEVWISEIMLQQTQVATVIPYYNAWMTKFPTIRHLAASDIDTVNGLWKGLGYYSRAARLLSGAKKVVDELGGRLPNNAKDMESKIPGVGRYSAGAICSIAYNECVPVLDGNVHRLLSRVLALHAPPKAKQSLDILWAGATSMVEGSDRPGDLNQALIELGSTVCKVRDPSCTTCPLRQWCRAHTCQNANKITSGANDVPDIEELCSLCEPLPYPANVTSFPMKAERKKAREELDIVNVIEWRPSGNSDDRWFLLIRRPEGGLLAGLHEFPTEPDVPMTITPTAMSVIPAALLSSLLIKPPRSGVERGHSSDERSTISVPSVGPSENDKSRIVKIRPAGDVVHVFSHIRKTYRVQWVLLEGGDSSPPPLVTPNLEAKGESLPKSRSKASKASKQSNSRGKNNSMPHASSATVSQVLAQAS